MKDLETLPKLYIRGDIAPKNNFMELFGGGETVSASDVVKFLQDNKNASEIVVEISSNGGFKSEGIEIRSLLKNSGKIVHTIGYKVNSIATVVFLSNSNGGKRLIDENAPFVIHFARIDPMNLGSEALTAEDLDRISAEIKRTDSQILDIYCDELGEEKRTELLAEMSVERDLGAKGAIKLGFAQGYYKKTKKKEKVQDYETGYLIEDSIAAYIQNKMENNISQRMTGLEKMISDLKKFFIRNATTDIKNEVTLPLKGGGNIYAVPANAEQPEDLMGASVYEVDAEGLPLLETPAADGEYILQDGRTLVVAGGKVTEVKEPIDAKKLQEDLAAEKEKSTQLQAEVDALKAQKTTLETQMKTELEKIQNEFKEFKKLVPGDKNDKKDDDDLEPPVDYSKMTIREKVLALRKEQHFK
jgi:ATP-dependent protease ClpP protease subunit